jgi:hypothetical protein
MTTGQRSGHPPNCEKAERPPCACACGGAEHGWQGALTIAAAPSDSELRRYEEEADRAWKEAAQPRKNQRKPGAQSTAGQRAAIKIFVADVIRWLRRDRDLHAATKQLGEPFRISRDVAPDAPRGRPTTDEEERWVEAHVIPQLRRKFGDTHVAAFQEQANQVHFWCELLAQTAHALDEFKGRYNRAKKAVIAVLTTDDGQHPDGWAALLSEQAIIKRAVELVFKQLPRAATGGIAVDNVFRLIWPARVLAVLMCGTRAVTPPSANTASSR